LLDDKKQLDLGQIRQHNWPKCKPSRVKYNPSNWDIKITNFETKGKWLCINEIPQFVIENSLDKISIRYEKDKV
jgi:hypothetical protein